MMNREKAIVRTSIIGVATNIILVGLKMLVGAIAGSIAIILDAVNNLTDILSSVVTIIGAKLAAREPDQDHPYGHGRSEYISALVVGIIILLTGVLSLIEAVPKVIHPELVDYSWATIAVVILAIFVKLALGVYVRRSGKKHNSSSLVASGVDALFDALLSFATLIGIIVTLVFRISIDGLLGVFIALFIIRTSIRIMAEAADDILGRAADQELTQKLEAEITKFKEVKSVRNLMLHNYGPNDLIGSVWIEVPEDMRAQDIYRLILQISHQIYTKFSIILTISICTAIEPQKAQESHENSQDSKNLR